MTNACGYVYIGETVLLEFDGDGFEDNLKVNYYEYADESDITISQISEEEYLSASEGGNVVASNNSALISEYESEIGYYRIVLNKE